ncbi:PREDICTED: LIM and calponin homology domains-containing protein 1-like [Cariama cristata]|uniref:LIM and calponin homology domains-containing protein 1-like n=1 Tax=Cariama cristata TaxID=54380 RepID=UPI000520322C|nr:PREDICTED: LIM and calponin homology domains-containing protein 1-like [Cariama cristata]
MGNGIRAEGGDLSCIRSTVPWLIRLLKIFLDLPTGKADASPVEADRAATQQVEASPGSAGPQSPACPSPGSDQKQFKSTAACASPVVKRLEFLPNPVPSEEAASSEKDVKKPEMEQQKEAELPAAPEVMKPKALEEEGSVVLPFLKKLPEMSQVTLQNSGLQADSDSGDKSNEKYQKEQDKLKEEWEKAQREVEEEERRYYEEERKIIEDTVVPFIVSSNSAELLSSSSSATEGNKTASSTDSNSSPEEGRQKEVTRQKKLLWEQDSMPSRTSKDNELWQEKRSGNKVLSGHSETNILKGGEQEHQVPVMERSSPARLNLPLTQDVSWNQQLLTKQSPHCTEDVRQRPFLGQSAGQQPSSAGETKRAGYHENFRSGPSSPCSPAAPSQSPNRSVSGKKLCSTCGLPLGKGAAMIIETLGLYFHIQCFRCGICKGQLGDAASGTDVRIRNGLLNCNDCYIRSRTAGQPTTL